MFAVFAKSLWGITGIVSGFSVCVDNIDNRKWVIPKLQARSPSMTVEQVKTMINLAIAFKTLAYVVLGPIGVYRKYIAYLNSCLHGYRYMHPIVMPMYYAYGDRDLKYMMYPVGHASWLPLQREQTY